MTTVIDDIRPAGRAMPRRLGASRRIVRYAAAAICDTALLYFIPLLVIFSDTAADAVRRSLQLSAASLVPSLFPYLVISALITRCGTAERIGHAVGRPFSRLCGLPPALAFPFIIGLCSGYPAGAAAVCSVYRRGGCTADDAERGCALLGNTGPGLTVGLLGEALLGSRRLGMIVYLAQLLAVLTVCALHGIIVRHKKLRAHGSSENVTEKAQHTAGGEQKTSERGTANNGTHVGSGHVGIIRALPEAVASATSTVLTVVSLVTVFSLLRILLQALLGKLSESIGIALPSCTPALLSILIEISDGLCCASAIGGKTGTVLCAAAVGWSGLCVITQTKTLMRNCGLVGCRIIPVRLALGALCAAYTFLLLVCHG